MLFASRLLSKRAQFVRRHTTIRPVQPLSVTSSTRTTFPRPRYEWQRIYRNAQQRRTYRQPLNYQRFQQGSNFFRRWSARPTFYYEVGGIAVIVGTFYTYNLEKVPVSHRRRFNVVSPETELSISRQMYEQVMHQYGGQILPAYHPKSRQVQRVLDRLIPHSGLEGEEWEVHVIESEEQNAFVIPGGKVFVFSGILSICRDDNGLATVLGHEIAHNVAHHAAERVSQGYILSFISFAGYFLLGFDPGIGSMVLDLAFGRPHSRNQETEADYIGLLMMAESCYDPEAAVGLWERMEKEEKVAVPQFISTHPSNYNRVQKMRDWMNEAEMKREQSGCGMLSGYANDFRSTVGMSNWSTTRGPYITDG